LLHILAVPGKVIEAKPKTSVLFVSVLLVLALATHGLTQAPTNPFQVTAQLTYFSGRSGYLEFLNFANQSGDVILTDGQTMVMNMSQIYIILFVPYDPNTQFLEWVVQGHADLMNNTQYMTQIMFYGDTTLVAITNPAIPIPEFQSGSMVTVLALTTIVGAIFWRKGSVSKANHRAAPEASVLC
jgi:hypothetical protein